jgi:hypothetical protein
VIMTDTLDSGYSGSHKTATMKHTLDSGYSGSHKIATMTDTLDSGYFGSHKLRQWEIHSTPAIRLPQDCENERYARLRLFWLPKVCDSDHDRFRGLINTQLLPSSTLRTLLLHWHICLIFLSHFPYQRQR